MSEERRYYGNEALDQKIERYVDYDGGYFVELGANDGMLMSNTLYFERYRDWHGLLVEPAPHLAQMCRARRSLKTHVYSYACTSFDYDKEFVEMCYSDLLTVALDLDSDLENPMAHAESGKPYIRGGEPNVRFSAHAIPLHHLLEYVKAPNVIDLLSLDVEGCELEVLKGIYHEQYRFKYMCIESRQVGRIEAYLEKQGYILMDQLSPIDYLFRDVRGKSTKQIV